jgi:hypothetical protein
VLADDGVDTVVNLTVPQAHFEGCRGCSQREARAQRSRSRSHARTRAGCLELAGRHGVRLSSAPTTLLGEAPQTLWKHVRDGAVRTVRAAYAEANWTGSSGGTPDPRSSTRSGRSWTSASTAHDPDRHVRTGSARACIRDHARARRAARRHGLHARGTRLHVAPLEHESGVVTRLTASFYVWQGKQSGIGCTATRARSTCGTGCRRIRRSSCSARGEYAGNPGAARAVQRDRLGPCARRSGSGDRRGTAAPCRRRARRSRRRILNAVESSAGDGGTIAVTPFTTPEPMDWAR